MPAAAPGAMQRQASDTVLLEGYLEKKGGSKGGFRNWYVTGALGFFCQPSFAVTLNTQHSTRIVVHRKSRWFVLKEEALYYYKSKEEPLLLGALPLRGAYIDDPDSANRPPEARYLFPLANV